MDDRAFYSTATDVVNDLDRELRRARERPCTAWRALELGAGSGRLLRAVAGRFSEIIGCEGNELSIAQARDTLADIPNAFLHAAEGTRVPQVHDSSIDFAYSVGDFAERAGRAGALELFAELRRVLRADGLARLRFTGQAPGAGEALFTAHELVDIAASNDFQVLSLEGAGSRSLLTTWQKRPEGWSLSTANEAPAKETAAIIRRIANASSNEAVAPCRGRFASILIYVENLPPDAGIGPLRVHIGGSLGVVTNIEPADRSGWQAVRVELPELEETGLLPVQILWFDRPIARSVTLRVIPPGPMVPRVISIGDANQPVSKHRIASGRVRLVLEEIDRPEEVQTFVGGKPTWDVDYLCLDPQHHRFEWKFQLPDEMGAGIHTLEIRRADRKIASIPLWITQ
jgi:SAM-dependent methyltransferase